MFSDTACIISVIVFAAGVLVFLLWMIRKRPAWTLILSWLASAIAFIAGITIINSVENSDSALITIGIIFLIASVIWFLSTLFTLAFVSISSSSSETPWWKYTARTLLLILSELLLLAALFAVFHFIGFIFFVFFIVATFRYFTAARFNRALELVSTLAAAMRQNLPLATALQTAALGRKDKTASIFCRIAYWLTQGCSLAQSIRKGYPRCLPELILAIETAENIHQLPQTLLSLEKDIVYEADETKKVRPVHPWYPVLVLIVVFIMTLALMIFIIPTFAEVLSEMSNGREGLPAATQLLLDIAGTITKLRNLLFIAGAIVTVVVCLFYYHFRTRISYKSGPFLNLVDRIRWFWPIHHRLERNLSTLRLVEILRPAMSAGLPFPEALTAVMGAKINICFKKRISRWLNSVKNGNDVAESARICGIGHSVAWALDDKINAGQSPELLEMIEEICRNKHNYLGNIIRSVMWPLVIVMLGAFVGFIVYAMFIPMVHIITIGVQYINP